MDKTKICRLLVITLVKVFAGIKPPEDIVVKAKINESSSLISVK